MKKFLESSSSRGGDGPVRIRVCARKEKGGERLVEKRTAETLDREVCYYSQSRNLGNDTEQETTTYTWWNECSS